MPLGPISVGLVLDIVGALLIWKFGLRESINRRGESSLPLEEGDHEMFALAKVCDRRSWIGMLLLVAGFALQLASKFLR